MHRDQLSVLSAPLLPYVYKEGVCINRPCCKSYPRHKYPICHMVVNSCLILNTFASPFMFTYIRFTNVCIFFWCWILMEVNDISRTQLQIEYLLQDHCYLMTMMMRSDFSTLSIFKICVSGCNFEDRFLFCSVLPSTRSKHLLKNSYLKFSFGRFRFFVWVDLFFNLQPTYSFEVC